MKADQHCSFNATHEVCNAHCWKKKKSEAAPVVVNSDAIPSARSPICKIELTEKYAFSQSCEKLQFKHLDMIMKVYRHTPRENSFVFVVVLEQ